MLATNEKQIIEAHINAITKLDNNKPVLAYALPSLDGILFGKRKSDSEKPEAAQHIYALAKRDPKLNLINKLQKFLASKDTIYNSIICDSAAIILAVLVSDHEKYQEYIEDVKIFIGLILSSTL